MRRKWLVLLGLAALTGLFAALRLHRKSQLEHFTARVERGEIRDVVDVTGTVNAVTTVQVGSQVSGTISRLDADFNSRVHHGGVIALIDPSLFRGALLQTTADLEGAKANLAAAEANLDKANATVVETKAAYERTRALVEQGLENQQTVELAKANQDQASASVSAAAAAVVQARAQIAQKQAAVSVARINLEHTVIRSPIDGVVVARNVDVGQTVAASLQAPTIFTIAQDLTRMQLYAKTDESDIGRIRAAQEVTFKVDAFPKETFHGAVSQIRMNATMVQNVVTYDVIIDFANPEAKLFPGMTAYVTIPVASVQNALKLPNSALHYRPLMAPEEIRMLYEKYGIEEGKPGSYGFADAEAATHHGTSGRDRGAQPEAAGAKAQRETQSDTAIIWKLHADNSIEPVELVLGITDHAFTEVRGFLKGELNEGDQVVSRSILVGSPIPGGPGAPGTPGARR
jgi:HlyD family secretion protein